ncbi:MAG: putative cytochrome [Nevskia sp.]|nr:putative cytochrome [Nevskia sp.]
MNVQESARVDTASVPAHVPADRVVPYDLLRISGSDQDPFKVMNALRTKADIFYTPVHFSNSAGAWVLTRAEDIRHVLQNPQLFSSQGVSGFSKLLGETWDMIPLELDPPRHTQFRAILNPLLSPVKIAQMQEGIRASCIELIDAVANQGGCDFVEAFAKPFPVRIFLQLMGLPLELFDQFLKWNNSLLFGESMEERIAAAAAIRDYLRQLIAERKKNPVKDLVSSAVQARVDGEPITDDEILGICYLLFVGGLDTVAASLSFYFRHLAMHPQQQQQLRENPALIAEAVEELLRTHAVVMVSRFVTADTEVAGVAMKQGDCIAIYTSFASFDPAEIDHPEVVDFNRSLNRHIAFSYGPHRCVGSHLARRELITALEEWTRRMPEFRIPSGAAVKMHGGVVFSIDRLPLVW